MRNPHPSTQPKPAKVARKPRATVAKLPPAFQPPRFHIPVVMVPGAHDGEVIVKAGRPVPMADEIGCPEFAREAKLSLRYVNQLCDDGTIKSRRKSNRPKSHYRIPRSELERYEAMTKEER